MGEAVMADTPMDVLVAGYQDLDKARKDFDGLVGLVKGRQIKVEGVILVAHDESGEVTVADTGDHAGRKGLGWGAGVGVVVGLLAPPLLARPPWAAPRVRWRASSPTTSSRPVLPASLARRCRLARPGSSRCSLTMTAWRSSGRWRARSPSRWWNRTARA